MKQSPRGLTRLQEQINEDQTSLRQLSKDNKEVSRPLVIDLGTYTTKVGFAPSSNELASSSECFPKFMIPTIVGQSKLAPGRLGESSSSANYGTTFVGFEALRRSTQLSLKYPMEHGIVMDWDDISRLIKYSVIDCLKVEFESLTSGLMITESALNPKKHRERMAQLAFEELEVPKFQVSMNSLNALYSEALTSGLVFECGEGLSTCVPIVDGYILSHAIQRLDIGGRDVNEYLLELLKPKALFTTTFEREFVRDIKEQCCFIKLKANMNETQLDKKRYQLPDGKMLDLTFEQHEAPEVLFNTQLIGRDEGQSIQDLLF